MQSSVWPQSFFKRNIFTHCSKKKESPYLIPEIKIKFRLETLTHDVSII